MSHADLLKLLLPSSLDPNGALLGAELVAEGEALDVSHGRAARLVEESDPRTTAELLADWERVADLPDPCSAERTQQLGPGAYSGILPTEIASFSRAGEGRYFAADGVLKTAPANEPRFEVDPITKAVRLLIEEARTNLLTYSEDFGNAAWIPAQAIIERNVAISPDGTLSADALRDTSVNDAHSIGQNVTTTAAAYTFSVYAKAGSRSIIWMRLADSTGAQRYAWFNLSAGVVGNVYSGLTASISPAGFGWYRCSITVGTAYAGSQPPRVGVSNADNVLTYVGDGTQCAFIWGAQLEVGAFPTSYIPTTPTFTSRASPATYFDAQGVLRTTPHNMLKYSEQFDNAAWAKLRTSVVADATVGPDGTMAAELLKEDGTTNSHVLSVTSLGLSAQPYTLSVYAKEHTRRYLVLYLFQSGTVKGVLFDTQTGEFVTHCDAANLVLSYSATAEPNGFYRLSITASGAFTEAGFALSDTASPSWTSTKLANYAGDGTSGIYLCGAQLEAADAIGEYTRTVGTTGVARDGYGLVNGQWVSKGLELEAAATNLIPYSSEFDGVGWTRGSATVTANAVLAPDGLQTADLVVVAGAMPRRIGTNTAIAVSPSTTYTASFWVKNVSMTSFAAQFFDVTSGSMSISSVNYTSQVVGTGWCRVSVSFTTPAGCTSILAQIFRDGSEGSFYLWGAQLETGPVATSYIPTAAAPVTRAADMSSSAPVTRVADVCSIFLPLTTQERNAALLARLTTIGGQAASYYVALAASLGYSVTVTEFDLHDVGDDVEAALYAEPWQHVWQINAGLNAAGAIVVTDSVDDPLAWWGSDGLECVVRRLKPAHTHVLFSYT